MVTFALDIVAAYVYYVYQYSIFFVKGVLECE